MKAVASAESHAVPEPRKGPTPAAGRGHLRIEVLRANDVQPELLWTLRYVSQRLQIPIRFLRNAVGNGDLILYHRTSANEYRVRVLDALALYQRAEREQLAAELERAERRREVLNRSRATAAAVVNSPPAGEQRP